MIKIVYLMVEKDFEYNFEKETQDKKREKRGDIIKGTLLYCRPEE